jgi:hypothetical protein
MKDDPTGPMDAQCECEADVAPLLNSVWYLSREITQRHIQTTFTTLFFYDGFQRPNIDYCSMTLDVTVW